MTSFGNKTPFNKSVDLTKL